MIRDNAYIFASSNLRAKEGAESARERLQLISNSQSLDALCQSAASIFGITEYNSPNDLFDRAMAKAVSDVREAVPDFSPLAPLLYKYDCTNIKLLIKCDLMDIDADGMLLSCASISKDQLSSSFKKGSFDPLPKNMKAAAATAVELYKKTGDAKIIDITLDNAAFADMAESAELYGNTLIKNIISARADAVNILTSLRLADSKADKDVSLSLLKRSLVVGGAIPHSAFLNNDSISTIDEIVLKATQSVLFDSLRTVAKGSYTFAEIEKIFDDAVLAMLSHVKYMAYGIEVAIRYLLVREAEILNCRIVAAGFGGSVASDVLRGRMRASYV